MRVTDQLNRSLEISEFPIRIVSLVPSVTELLFDLGLEKEIAGITKFCVHPENIFNSKPRIGGTKKIDHEKIRTLSPDLILANKEENLFDDVQELSKHYPVWVGDVNDMKSALEMISMTGLITGKHKRSEEIIQEIKTGFQKIEKKSPLRVLYLIWQNPFMGAASGTFIDSMITHCGWSNVLEHQKRYPELTYPEIKSLNPDLILLSTEPFPFTEQQVKEIQNETGIKVTLADGEYFSWYGSRMIKAPSYFNQLIRSTADNSGTGLKVSSVL